MKEIKVTRYESTSGGRYDTIQECAYSDLVHAIHKIVDDSKAGSDTETDREYLRLWLLTEDTMAKLARIYGEYELTAAKAKKPRKPSIRKPTAQEPPPLIEQQEAGPQHFTGGMVERPL